MKERALFAEAVCLVAVGVVVLHLALFVLRATVKASSLATTAGLTLDILGATLLVSGLLWTHMAAFRATRKLMEVQGATPRGWGNRIALRIAWWVGYRDVRATEPTLTGDYVDAFWGLMLLALGFLGQLLGVVLSVLGK